MQLFLEIFINFALNNISYTIDNILIQIFQWGIPLAHIKKFLIGLTPFAVWVLNEHVIKKYIPPQKKEDKPPEKKDIVPSYIEKWQDEEEFLLEYKKELERLEKQWKEVYTLPDPQIQQERELRDLREKWQDELERQQDELERQQDELERQQEEERQRKEEEEKKNK